MPIYDFQEHTPRLAPDVFVAPNATVIGDVEIGPGSSVWFGAVIRGDSGPIRIGAGVSVQDNVVIHVNDRDDTIIEDEVTIGHGAVLEGCRVGRGSLIGMNATVLSGATVGAGAIVAAGAVVREGFVVPTAVVVAGVPAKVRGDLSTAVQERLTHAADHYRAYAQIYKEQLARSNEQ
ncbi:MAG: gamma carbonic anhydrase family protein [Anaerolineales bacterium]|nr:gamma carbonic anhydrase family protein [Anaerolineales bacterium]